MKILSVEQIRQVEKSANEGGLSYLEMMKRAGIGCAKAFLHDFDNMGYWHLGKSVAVICGKGRNAGDGFVFADYLARHGYEVNVLLVYGEPTDEVCVAVYEKMKQTSVKIFSADEYDEALDVGFFVDAVFGIGFHGELDEKLQGIFNTANVYEWKKRIALDIPSGFEADSVKRAKGSFKADKVYTMIAPKFCLNGINTQVIDIGVSGDFPDFNILCDADVKKILPARIQDSHKGSFGTVLSVAGSYEMPGAGVLCANSAVNSGCGLVISAFPEKAYNAITPKITEPVLMLLSGDAVMDAENLIEKSKKCRALVLGPGIGKTEYTEKLVSLLLQNVECAIVLDADGLNCIAENPDILKNCKSDIVITPHPAEMSRLTGLSVNEIQSDRQKIATDFAKKYNVTVLLKGHHTIIASPTGNIYMNMSGNSGLAKGGSGDVLTGLIGGLIAQGMSSTEAAAVGAYIHGKSAERVCKIHSEYGCTPTRLVNTIGKVMKALSE